MMQDLKMQNRLTHDFMHGDFASLLKMTAAAFAALMVLGGTASVLISVLAG